MAQNVLVTEWSKYTITWRRDTRCSSRIRERVAPVVDREHREADVERAVGERQRLCNTSNHRVVVHPLPDHLRRRFDRHHPLAGRFVVAGARADVDHGDVGADRGDDCRGDPRVLATRDRVRAADRLVGRTRSRHAEMLSRALLERPAPGTGRCETPGGTAATSLYR